MGLFQLEPGDPRRFGSSRFSDWSSGRHPRFDLECKAASRRSAYFNALRDDLCEVFAIATELQIFSGEEKFKYREEKRSRAPFLIHRIRLRLDNPDEERSKGFLELIRQLFEVSHTELEGVLADAESKARSILKAGMETSKGGAVMSVHGMITGRRSIQPLSPAPFAGAGIRENIPSLRRCAPASASDATRSWLSPRK